MEREKIDFKKYILVFFLTVLVFISGFLFSHFFNQKKLSSLNQIQKDLNLQLLSLETQFSILKEAPCNKLNESTLTLQLYNISQRLKYISQTLGKDNPDFLRAKKYYSLLELKHWLLLKRAAQDCNWKFTFILYFYSDKKDCPKCQDQGVVLTYLRKKYYFLRVYSFDWNLDLSALSALKSIYSLKKELPILIIDGKVYYGFKSKKELEDIISSHTYPGI